MPPFNIVTNFKPQGDQPQAIKELSAGIETGLKKQVLLGVTGSGKTFTLAQVIAATQRTTLVVAPNKTLAAQLYGEFRNFFPETAVEFFISYYDETNNCLMFVKSADGGDSWSTPIVVDSPGNVGEYTSIAATDTNNIFISYYDRTNGDLKFDVSIDGGDTWNPGDIRTVDSAGDVGYWNSIAAVTDSTPGNGPTIFISYRDASQQALNFAKSTDGGNSCTSQQSILHSIISHLLFLHEIKF